MNQTAAVSSSYVTLPLNRLVESSTNPRRTFEPSRLAELAQSIAANGLIQPITVRPCGEQYEIVAGARRFRAARLAELDAVPVRILELSDDQALEVQVIENSQRQDVHPYEEAAGYQQLLKRPGNDAAAVAAKCGKSESHVYSRLSLLALIPEAVEAFQQERITATHANLLARLTPQQQQTALPQCWRKDFHDGEYHLLAARYLNVWIRQNLYLPLAKAPFDREDEGLLPAAGSCSACPKRTGFHAALFCDFQDDEQCLDATCYQSKLDRHIDRELRADSDLFQIEAAWRPVAEQSVGSVQLNELWQLNDDSPQCDAVGRGIIVYGNRIGTIISVCSRKTCAVHNPQIADAIAARALAEQDATKIQRLKEEAARSAPQPTEEELEQARQQEDAELGRQEQMEAEAREAKRQMSQEDDSRRQREHAEQQRREAQAAAQAQQRAAEQKKRDARFHRMLKRVPETLSPAQLRFLLTALVHVEDFERLLSDVAEHVAGANEDDRRSADEVMHEAIQNLTDPRVSNFAVKFALACHRGIPYQDQTDLLAEAETVFPLTPATNAAAEEPVLEIKKRRKA